MTEEVKEKKLTEIMDETADIKCSVQKALYFVDEFLKGPMCGKCFPCEMGSYEARVRLRAITMGQGNEGDIPALRRIAAEMAVSSRCKKGKDTAAFIDKCIAEGAFEEHIGGRCAASECTALMQYVIVSAKCTSCGICQDVCKHNAVVGERKTRFGANYLPFHISQKRCVKCGDCLPACPEGAIEFTGVSPTEEAKV